MKGNLCKHSVICRKVLRNSPCKYFLYMDRENPSQEIAMNCGTFWVQSIGTRNSSLANTETYMLLYRYCLVLLCIWGQFPSTSPWGLIFGGAISQTVFCVTSLGGLYLEGLMNGEAYFRNLRYISCSCLIWRIHVKILWSLYSHYSSAKRNPSNSKSSPLPEGWKWALMQQKQQAAKDGRTTGTFSLKCPSTTSPSASYLSYVTVCLCAGPS